MTDQSSAHPILAAGKGLPALKIGSEEHKRAFCRMLLDTHDPYRPAVIPWPKLEDEAFKRLTGIEPNWSRLALPREQDIRAAILYRSRGSAPWPVCGRVLP